MNDKRAVVNNVLLFFASTIHFLLCQEVFFKLPDSLKTRQYESTRRFRSRNDFVLKGTALLIDSMLKKLKLIYQTLMTPLSKSG